MKKLDSSLKNMLLSLTLITVGATAILAFVNQLTAGPIAQAETANLRKAIAQVVPGFDNNPAQDTASVKLNGNTYKVYKASKGGQSIGAAVQATDNKAFHGNLTVLVGFNKDGNITGYSILNSTETPGLGLKAKDWFQKGGKGNIIGKNPGDNGFSVKKDGGEIDAITASTITSRAFLRAVNEAYHAYRNQTGATVNAYTGASQQHKSNKIVVKDLKQREEVSK
jgi:electron transport complex protein RnfG